MLKFSLINFYVSFTCMIPNIPTNRTLPTIIDPPSDVTDGEECKLSIRTGSSSPYDPKMPSSINITQNDDATTTQPQPPSGTTVSSLMSDVMTNLLERQAYFYSSVISSVACMNRLS